MAERYDYDLDENLNLYLDGRLSGEKREAFERRLRTDPKLRRAVEFHRGLTLDLREATPPLPSGYAERARARLRADTRAGAEPGRTDWFRSPTTLRVLATVGAMLVAALVLWPVARRVISPGPGTLDDPDAVDRASGPDDQPVEPDEETLEALRSLGYISSGGGVSSADRSEPADQARPAAGEPRTRDRSSQLRADVVRKPEAGRKVGDERAPAASQRPVGELEEGGAAAPAPTALKRAAPEVAAGYLVPATDGMAFEVLGVSRAPEPGRDHELITATEAWAALFEGTEPPAIDFRTHRVVLLRDALGTDPPSRLSVETVSEAAEALVITCRIERPGGARERAPLTPGQAVLVPAGDLPIRVVILP